MGTDTEECKRMVEQATLIKSFSAKGRRHDPERKVLCHSTTRIEQSSEWTICMFL